MYYYKRTEPQLWTVGHDVGGKWEPESDHDNREDAAKRVAHLSGGDELAQLQAKYNELLEWSRLAYQYLPNLYITDIAPDEVADGL